MTKCIPIAIYRSSRALSGAGVPALPRVLDYVARLIFGCWIPHTARIGRRVSLGYQGLGVVIHNDAVIGDDVEIGHLVTIGGNGRTSGAPVVGSNVYIGAGAKIIGAVTVGDNSVIGANAVVVRDVPPGSLAVGVPSCIKASGIDANHHIFHRRNNGSH